MSELLIAAFTGTEAPPLSGGIDRRKSALQRLMQTIEARLPDAELNLAALAESEGMSIRAVQKLFQRENSQLRPICAPPPAAAHRAGSARPAAEQAPGRGYRLPLGVFRPGAFFPRLPRTIRDDARHVPRAEFCRHRNRRWRCHARAPENFRVTPPPDHRAGARQRRRRGTRHAASGQARRRCPSSHPLERRTMHWGYFSKSLPPILTVRSGDIVTIETLTQHATDDSGAHGGGR